jgi:predicted short-subunit dehydrogenase-like oxidoreductase (DUF2520 family)
MQITIIGTGNTATVLGRALVVAGHRIKQVYGREQSKAMQLAALLSVGEAQQCAVTDSLAQVAPGADLYVVAVSDTGLSAIAAQLRLPGELVVHTAGAVTKNILQPVSERYGVFYPLQSLRRERDDLPPMPILADAADAADLSLLLALGRSISREVQPADDAARLKLHVAAVLVNNFTNHLYALAADFCEKESVDFRLLLPLLLETANRAQEHAPATVQTGPALRGDAATIGQHLQLLNTHPHLQEIYRLLTDSIQQFHLKK